MFADKTTIYVMGHTVDIVSLKLNEIISKFWVWCLNNALTPHPGKTEYMLMGGKSFVDPKQAVKLGNSIIKRVQSTRCLGMELDDELKWSKHVLDLIKQMCWKTLKQIYLESLAKLVQKIYYQTVPTTMIDFLEKRSLWYNLRETNCLSLSRVRTEMMKKSISYKGSVL